MKVKKKYKERSARFRFWRNLAMFLLGIIIGFFKVYFGSLLKSKNYLIEICSI